jgi:hypothetical protein
MFIDLTEFSEKGFFFNFKFCNKKCFVRCRESKRAVFFRPANQAKRDLECEEE